jgi:hypothetical protein
VSAAIEIADKAGIRYPFDNENGFPYVLISNFLITASKGEFIRRIRSCDSFLTLDILLASDFT